jgi:hypothetical protein
MADEPTPTPTPTPAPEAKWFDSFDDTDKNYITQRGLADKDPVEAFKEAAKAHREAQAYIGVPKEQLLKLPKADAPPEEWDAVHEKLGWSKNADDYKLDGVEADDGFKDLIRNQANELKLSPDAAKKLAENVGKYLNDNKAASASEDQAAAVKAMEQLKNSWGSNFEANKVIADNAYAAIQAAAGFDQETMTKAIQQLGAVSGKAEVMQMLLAVGQRLGEDKFVGGGGPGGSLTPRTAEGAKARIEELKKDTEFTKRWLAGGSAEAREMNDLHALAFGNA